MQFPLCKCMPMRKLIKSDSPSREPSRTRYRPHLAITCCVLCLDARSPWRLLVFPQTRQQLPKPLLPCARRAAFSALPAEVHQLGNPIPAGTTRACIFAARHELLCLATCLGDVFVALAIVQLVEVVNGLLRGFNGLGLLVGGNLGAVLEGE